MKGPLRIWVQGAGEMASGVALCLARAGCALTLAERPDPVAVRRMVVFSEAVYEGQAQVEELSARLADRPDPMAEAGSVTVVVDPSGALLSRFEPHAIVDGRLTKRQPLPLPRGRTPLIGLGPGFTCGVEADLVIETHRPEGPGRLITRGEAAPNTGTPGLMGGHALTRVVRAPVAGRFDPQVAIGDMVTEGQLLGHVQGHQVTAGVGGLIRGLVHPLAELSEGEKVGDVDPRGRAIDPQRVSDKALAIGEGVLAGLVHLGLIPKNPSRGRFKDGSGVKN
jgi:xanthine dehydrogenase accessory factor